MSLAELKKTEAFYDRQIKDFGRKNYEISEKRVAFKKIDPAYSILSKKIEKNIQQMTDFKKIRKLVQVAIARKAETETEEPEAVVAAGAVETVEPIVAADSETAPAPEAKAEVAEKIDTKPMLAFLKAFGLPKSEYTGTTKKSSDQLIAENFYDYKKVFDQVIRNWESIPGSLRPPMLIEDSRGNKLPTFAKFAEAMVSASPKDREKIKNSYIEFTSVVGGGGAIGSLAGAELSGNSGSSGVNPETFFASHKTTANMGATRRSAVVPGTTSAARPAEVAPVAPVVSAAEVTSPIPPREELLVVSEKMIPGKWSGLLEKSGRRVENVSTTVGKALQELPALGRLEFGTQSEGNSLVVEKQADGKFKLTGIEGGKPVEKGVVDKLDFQTEQGGSFFGLTWTDGEYRNIREYRSLAAEVAEPAVVIDSGKVSVSAPSETGKPVESTVTSASSEIAAAETQKIAEEYRKSKGSELQKISFELDLEMEKDPGNEELKLKRKVLDRVLGEKYKELVASFIKDHNDDSVLDLEAKFSSLEEEFAGLKEELSEARRLRNPIGEIKLALTLCIGEKDAVEMLIKQKRAEQPVETSAATLPPPEIKKPVDSTVSADSSTEPAPGSDSVEATPATQETAKDEAAILAEYRKEKGSVLQRLSFELDAALKEDPENTELKSRREILNGILGEKFEELVKNFIAEHEDESVADLEGKVSELTVRVKNLTNELARDKEEGQGLGQVTIALTKCRAELSAVERLLVVKKAELSTAEVPVEAASAETKPDKAEKPPVVEAPIDLKSSIQQELNERYQVFVRTLTEKMKDLPTDKLEERISRLTTEEERLVERNTNPQRLLKVRAEIQAANDLLRLIEAEEEAASSATEVSSTPSPEAAPTEAAPPVETLTSTPAETEASPVSPAAVSPIGPVEFNEATGEKSLKDMDASELQKKARELSGEKSKLEARLLAASKNKKPKLQARIDSLNEELTQVNQELASR